MREMQSLSMAIRISIYDGIIPTVDATIAGEFGRIMDWADKYRTMKVRTNADTPEDAKKAVELGAEGIDSAVQSICSSAREESMHSVR